MNSVYRLCFVFTATLAFATVPTFSWAVPFFLNTFTSNSQLWLVDPDTGSQNLVGNTGVANLTDLALASNGDLLAVSLNQLYSVNPVNAESTAIGALANTSRMVGLDFAGDGLLYGVEQQATGGFFQIDAGTGEATLLFNTGFSYAGDVAHYRDTIFYATAVFSDGSHLIEIDSNANSAIDRGLIAAGQDSPGLDFDTTGRLIAFSTSGNSYLIPDFASSGAGGLLSTTSILMAGATTTPIPIPPAVWLFGSGLLGLVGVARRRAK